MNITAETIHKITEIQNKKPNKSYYKENRFYAFALSFGAKKSTVIASLMKSLSIETDEAVEYLGALRSAYLLTKEDEKIISKVPKASKEDKKIYSNEIQEIMEHLNKVLNKRFLTSDKRKRRINSLLSSGNFTVRDFKMVNRYFASSWGESIKMTQYLTPETLYNAKFESRVEISRAYFETYNNYASDMEALCDSFSSLFRLEVLPSRNNHIKQIENKTESCEIIEDEIDSLLEKVSHKLKSKILHWLSSGYSREVIETTIDRTVKAWSKKEELRDYITVSKILDDGFPKRVAAVANILRKETAGNFKPSVNAVDAWSV